MEITLVPQRNDATLTLAKSGSKLIINGAELDFTTVIDTQTWKALSDENENQATAFNNPLLRQVRRDNGLLRAWVIYPYAAGQQPEWETTVTTVETDGPIALPA